MLTEYLKEQFETPLVFIDIGARFGIDQRWQRLGDKIKAYCFETDKEECDRLNGAPNVIFIPQAISGRTGKATLYHAYYPESTGLYKTNDAFFNRLLNKDNAEVIKEEEIDVMTLDDAMDKYNIPDPDFIKIDVEGAELDVLKGTDLTSVFGIFTEFRFHKEINGSPTFSELDQYLTNRGFMLYSIWTGKQSRKDLPYPGPALTFNGKRFHAGTNGGQVMDGDALYLRDSVRFKNCMQKEDVLKAACIYELFDLNDCAAELLIAHDYEDVSHCLDLLSGGSYKVYLENY